MSRTTALQARWEALAPREAEGDGLQGDAHERRRRRRQLVLGGVVDEREGPVREAAEQLTGLRHCGGWRWGRGSDGSRCAKIGRAHV